MKRYPEIIAIVVACAATLILPGVASYIGYRSARAIVMTEAEINAREVTQLVNANPELWRVEAARLTDILDRRPGDRTAEIRVVLDLKERVIGESRDAVDPPLLTMEGKVYDAGAEVGVLRISRSLRPLQVDAAWLLLAGIAFSGLAYAGLKYLSRRALRGDRERLAFEANHDPLTGLPNRVLFHDMLELAMTRAQRDGRTMTLMFLDIDRFKVINDSLGHQFGDQLLCHVARTVGACLQRATSVHARDAPGCAAARLGGDKFALIVDRAPDSAEDPALLARQLLDALQQPFTHAGQSVYITASIGIALYAVAAVAGGIEVGVDALIRQAEMAMYRAKELGRNTCEFFNEGLDAAAQQRMDLDSSLRRAVELHEFVLHYQPKADLITGAITGVEALIRWERPGHGLVMPDRFIEMLEENGLIVPVGAWVVATACAQMAEWDQMGMPPLSIAVNLSARQFRQPDLAQQIRAVLEVTRLAPGRVELEITEGLMMEDSELSRAVLLDFDDMGVRVAIDDFGTGHSSLAYLKRFRVDTLKIDRSFVRDLPDSADDCAIAKAVVALGRSMNLSVVAEGVETHRQAAFLRELGCNAMQGYLLSRPLAAPAMLAWLQSNGVSSEAFRPRVVAGSAHVAPARAAADVRMPQRALPAVPAG